MSAAITLALSFEADGWEDEDRLERHALTVLDAAAVDLATRESQPFPAEPPEVSLVFADDAFVRAVNAEWRRQDKATNVLSFPAFPLVPGGMPGPLLGDILIARETVMREAADLEKSMDDHLTHLLVHGFLHLFGYDHLSVADAEKMEGIETRILAALGLSDPYAGTEPVLT